MKWTLFDMSPSGGRHALSQAEYVGMLEEAADEWLVLADLERVTAGEAERVCRAYLKDAAGKKGIAFLSDIKPRLWLGGIRNLWSAAPEVVHSPLLIGRKEDFLKAYGGADLSGDTLSAVAYSLQKAGGMRFVRLEGKAAGREPAGKWRLWRNYTWGIPGKYLFSGLFFRQLFRRDARVLRDMVCRMLLVLSACFALVFMPYISRDYGVSGDEFVDHRHAGYVLDYFGKGDKAALDQPKTALHLYGNAVQVVTAAVCRWFEVENYYELRHFVCGLVGATGVLAAGLLGLRWGGGLGGLLTLWLMFFTPRFFGHSMNNLKDVPFAVGYVLSLLYTVRLFDCFPAVRLRHVAGLVLGIALTLGTRSGGLILYPMLVMYAGLYYISEVGVREFYKFGKYRLLFGRILRLLLVVVVVSYLLAILLWPYALVNPLGNVMASLTKFTNYNVGLRTIFDGEQMMSNMLPWKYAPKYLCIGMPVVTLLGFFGWCIYAAVRKREFSLLGFFLWFAVVFPIFWVIYKNSNLYGGIRHLLFVMPPMVVIAGRFWSEMIHAARRAGKGLAVAVVVVFIGLAALPAVHAWRNHPNEYVYFNEFKGGLKGAYGDYETDYYFNSLKESADWFRANILPGLPKDRETIVVTQALEPVKYYFRRDTNIRVIYSRFYEKYSKNWDYALFGNVYISRLQLKEGLFPPEGTLFTTTVDGLPMSYVSERVTKQELEGFRLEKEKHYGEALQVFETYVAEHPKTEEVWSRMGKLYYMNGQLEEAKIALDCALALYPDLNEALYIKTLLCMDLKDYRQALQTADHMLEVNRFSVEGRYLKALVHYHTKNYQAAITELNRLLMYRRNYDRAYMLAGDILRDNGSYEKAFRQYETATKYTKAPNAYVSMADMLVRLKRYPQAGELLNSLAQSHPSYYPVCKVRCRMALQEGKWQEAAAYLAQLNAIDNDAEVFVLRGMYHEGVKQPEIARVMWDKALEADSGNVEAIRMKNRK